MDTEPLTDELLQKLLNSATPEAYLSSTNLRDRSLMSYAQELLDKRGLKRSVVFRECGINATFGYQVLNGERRVSRDNAIKLTFGLRCTLQEAQRFLHLAGVAELWPKSRRDAIIIYCINQGMTRVECDDELYRFGEKTLLSEE